VAPVTTPPDPQRGDQQPDRSGPAPHGQGGSWGGQRSEPYNPQQGQYGQPAHFGQPPGQYGDSGQYGQQQGQYGQPAQYGQPPGQYGDSGQPGQYGQPAQYGPPPGQYGDSGQPGQYGQQQGQPGQYGQGPAATPYPGGTQYAYNPYGPQQPAGLDSPPEPVSRPGSVALALALLIAATLPFVALGVIGLVVPITPETFPAGLELDQTLADNNLTFETFVTGIRVMSGILLVIAAVYILLAVLAFRGINGARITLTVLTALFGAALLILFLPAAFEDPLAFVFVLPVVLSAAGVVLLFRGPAGRYFARPRR
jgi:hypothetical protein